MNQPYDLLVIGAGPAGMSAAAAAAELGMHTLLVEQQPSAGGQIYRAAEKCSSRLAAAIGHDHCRGVELAHALRASGAEFRRGTAVFDIPSNGWIGLTSGADELSYIQAHRIVVATGAMERPFPVAGWTLPGAMTAGAAQLLLKEDGLVPEGRVVLAGTGPLALLLAFQLRRAGAKLTAYLDTTPRGNYAAALRYLPIALRNHAALRQGFRLIAELRKHDAPWHAAVEEIRIEGDGHVETVVFRQRGVERTIAADMVLLHQGVVPNIQITQALRCRHAWDDRQLCWRPETDFWGRSSEPNVFVAGDGRGIMGAVAAESQGRLAALAVAHDLGRIETDRRDRLSVSLFRRLARERALRPFLDRLYRPADRFRIPDDKDVIICRCEEVRAGQVRRAVCEGASGPNQMKAFLRAGMGHCQGRMCGLTVCEMIADEKGVPPAEVGYYRLRPPITPVRLGAYARLAAEQPQPRAATAAAGDPGLE